MNESFTVGASPYHSPSRVPRADLISVGIHDGILQPPLVDDRDGLLSAGGHPFSDPFVFLINVVCDGICKGLSLAIAQCLGDVLACPRSMGSQITTP